jgi:hypothetical protein
MAILRVDCGTDGRADLRAFRDLAPAPAGPTVLLVHGFKYDPAHPCATPTRTLYAQDDAPETRGGRLASWPRALGLAGPAGLAVGFAWPARAQVLGPLLRHGRNGFAEVYAAAAAAGAGLAATAEAAARARPQPVDVLAHSLGARVALCALRALAAEGRADVLARVGRLILLGPAEFAGEARAALDACARLCPPGPEVYAFTARGNAPFDRLFEALGPWGMGRSLGRGGLGEARSRWIDLAFDDPRFAPWAAAQGLPLAPAGARPCHWSFYARPGAMALHRAILDRRPGLDVAQMRASGAPTLTPRARRPFFGGRLPPAPLSAEPA